MEKRNDEVIGVIEVEILDNFTNEVAEHNLHRPITGKKANHVLRAIY